MAKQRRGGLLDSASKSQNEEILKFLTIGDNNGKQNIYNFYNIFRGKPRFDENCTAMAKLQHISKTMTARKT